MSRHSSVSWRNEVPGQSWDDELFARGGHFLQSTHWATFNKWLGRKLFFGRGPGWQCFAILERTNKVTRLFCPYGPVADSLESYQLATTQLRALAKDEGAMFVRVEPWAPVTKADLERLMHTPALRDIHPSLVFQQDLTKPREQILREMSKNNRQRYRNAAKNGVRVDASHDPSDVEHLLMVVHEVAAHNHIVQPPDDYFRTMVSVLLPRDAATLYIARHHGEPVSAALVFDGPTTRHVAHSGSLHSHRNAHPGAIMRATMMLDAQERGLKTFDSLGVAPPGEPDHPWAGVTTFKLSFGGDYRYYLGTWELPASPLYYAYRSVYRAYSATRR
ncbi:lipid II:glycine glycyltransferase FemX [Dactylosporangium sp. NPDC051541]|uniref:lipid II:glycine glycyltransferase FemX n=1 Tax=Dactylosporangium sp. NPDC051541 TaxID=3363977 RepID=UPI0037A3580E